MAGTLFNREFEPPDPDESDTAYKVVKAVVDLLPAGGLLFEHLFKPPIERRSREWQQEIAAELRRLSDSRASVDLADLPNDEQFVDAVLVATQAAIRTSQPLKRKALRNAVLNAALRSSVDATMQQIFLNLTDRFTDRHLLLLQFAQDARTLTCPDGSPIPSHARATQVLHEVFHDARDNAQLYESLWTDLYTARLVRLDRLENGPEGDARSIRRTTTLGDAYLAFITSPLPSK